MHTPASHDYETPELGYLGILQMAERRGLSIIAFTDHNTVNGFRKMQREIDDLTLLERLERIKPDELGRLNEFRRLLKKITVMPGFEFTATFGFHILGIFPPEKALRDVESVLVKLNVPGNVLDHGLTEAGATADVLTAYKAIAEAGGMAIAAHANSTHGVSMREMDFGGQTRIAFTQDPNLIAIEWTDLERGRRSSSWLVTGVRQEYPRKMHAIQGSDSHRDSALKSNPKRLGIGERTTEVQLAAPTFAELRALFVSPDFHRVRPVFDILDVMPEIAQPRREAGESATQAFHAVLAKKPEGQFAPILRDATAFANASGGTIWFGCDANSKKKTVGVKKAHQVAAAISNAIASAITPLLHAELTVVPENGVDLIRIVIPNSNKAPHTLQGTEFLIRDGIQTRIATRDEIVALARKTTPVEVRQLSAVTVARVSEPRETRPSSRDQRDGRNYGPRRESQAAGTRTDSNRSQPAPTRARTLSIGSAKSNPDVINSQVQAMQPIPQDSRSQEAPLVQRAETSKADTNDRPSSAQVRRPLPPHRGEQSGSAPATAQLPDQLTRESIGSQGSDLPQVTRMNMPRVSEPAPKPAETLIFDPGPHDALPKSGVEVVGMEERGGTVYFALRDTRNGGITRNVTFKSARDLWHYAITMHNRKSYAVDKINWKNGQRAILSSSIRAGKQRFDVAFQSPTGPRIVYGVTTDGIDQDWKALMDEIAPGAAG